MKHVATFILFSSPSVARAMGIIITDPSDERKESVMCPCHQVCAVLVSGCHAVLGAVLGGSVEVVLDHRWASDKW